MTSGMKAGVTSEAARWIESFLEAQAAELDASDNTRLAYGRDLIDAASWLERQSQSFQTASRDHIEGYLISCDAAGLARSTRARRLSSLAQAALPFCL